MIPVQWSRDKISMFVDAINNGKPLVPPDERGWTGRDMMIAAGCLFAGMYSQGSTMYDGCEHEMHQERAEAFSEQITTDLQLAATWLRDVALAVIDENYAEHFEDEAVAFIGSSEGGAISIVPVHGFRL